MRPNRRAISVALFACALSALAVAVWDLTAGGFHIRVFGLRISSWEAYKPFRLGMVAMVAAFWLHDRDAAPDGTSWNRLAALAPSIAGAAAGASFAIAIHFGIFAAGGADGYGYVSQAHLWASGRLVVQDRLAALAPLLGDAIAPLGYQLAASPGAIVPKYPPGLPLMMAAGLRLGGPSAVYFVVPSLAGLTVWLTYALARRTTDARTAMIAAVLLAFSPIFVFQSLEPMSDVPVTACWMAAWVLAMSPGRWSPLGAGLAVSAAVLTRPNLVPLTVVFVPILVSARPFARRLAWFALGVVPGCVAIAVLNHHLYGSPVRSGYGSLSGLYEWSRLSTNLPRYFSWLVELNTPGILLAFAAPLVGRAKAGFWMLVFTAMLLASYLFYNVFDTWPFLRFLLPAIPLLFILSSDVVVSLLERAPPAWRGALISLLCVLLPCWYVLKAHELTVFAIKPAEHRYVAVGEEVGRALERNAVVLTLIESGSVRMYGDRPTVRWDLLEPAALDHTIGVLETAGYVPYLLLEDWEAKLFRERFEHVSVYGNVDWPPTFEYSGPISVRVYALADRARYLRGQRVVTRRIASAST
jgi:hypothetical protein